MFGTICAKCPAGLSVPTDHFSGDGTVAIWIAEASPDCMELTNRMFNIPSNLRMTGNYSQSTRIIIAILGVLMMSSLSGCASSRYAFGKAEHYRTSPELASITTQQIERGRPHAVIDGFGWVWGIPSKIILWDRRVENHRIDERTEAEIATYLADNQLSTVKVRLNQYRPLDDWNRLVANKAVGAGWRYTLGALSVAGEALFPGRLFGGDHYNPFTNTIHIYSNVPAIAFHEGGHAKDFAQRKWKGTYAALYLLPAVPLYHEAIATEDALTYVLVTRDAETQREAYNILYPAYGTYIGNAINDPFGIGYIAGVLVGHAAGRWMSSQIEDPPPVRSRPPATEQSSEPVVEATPVSHLQDDESGLQ